MLLVDANASFDTGTADIFASCSKLLLRLLLRWMEDGASRVQYPASRSPPNVSTSLVCRWAIDNFLLVSVSLVSPISLQAFRLQSVITRHPFALWLRSFVTLANASVAVSASLAGVRRLTVALLAGSLALQEPSERI